MRRHPLIQTLAAAALTALAAAPAAAQEDGKSVV